MASIGETKKLVKGITTQMTGLSKGLDTSTTKYAAATTRTEKMLAGSATDVQDAVVGKMRKAAEDAVKAKTAVDKAVEACSQYLLSKI